MKFFMSLLGFRTEPVWCEVTRSSWCETRRIGNHPGWYYAELVPKRYQAETLATLLVETLEKVECQMMVITEFKTTRPLPTASGTLTMDEICKALAPYMVQGGDIWPTCRCLEPEKKYSDHGCVMCWSCKKCGTFGGCDNTAGRIPDFDVKLTAEPGGPIKVTERDVSNKNKPWTKLPKLGVPDEKGRSWSIHRNRPSAPGYVAGGMHSLWLMSNTPRVRYQDDDMILVGTIVDEYTIQSPKTLPREPQICPCRGITFDIDPEEWLTLRADTLEVIRGGDCPPNRVLPPGKHYRIYSDRFAGVDVITIHKPGWQRRALNDHLLVRGLERGQDLKPIDVLNLIGDFLNCGFGPHEIMNILCHDETVNLFDRTENHPARVTYGAWVSRLRESMMKFVGRENCLEARTEMADTLFATLQALCGEGKVLAMNVHITGKKPD